MLTLNLSRSQSELGGRRQHGTPPTEICDCEGQGITFLMINDDGGGDYDGDDDYHVSYL